MTMDHRRYLAEAMSDVARWRDEAPWWVPLRQADADWHRARLDCEAICESVVGLEPQQALLTMLASCPEIGGIA